MSWIDRVFGGLLGRPVAALPEPVPVPAARADSTYNPLTRLGGWTDKGAVARPSQWTIPLTDDELRSLYANNGIARRIVDIVPSRATRRGWSSPDIPPAEYRRLRAWARVREAMQMGRLYGDALLLLVTEDDIPPRLRSRPDLWLREPLDLARVGKLHAVQVFDAGEASPLDWEASLASPDYRMPRLWSLSGPSGVLVVHASRAIVFRGSRRPPSETRWSLGRTNTMPDASVLQVIWDEIRRLTETMAGGATLAQELRESVLKVAGLGARGTGDEAADLEARISLLQRTKSLLGMILVGEQDDYSNRSNPPTGFADLSDAAKSMLAAVTGIPEVVLYGSTPSGLNTDGESSWEGFRQLVSDYQETHREELEYLDRVIYAQQDGPTGGQIPEDGEGELVFAPLDEPSQESIAALRKTVAETDAVYIASGVYSPEEVARSRFGEAGWSLDLEPVEIPDPAVEDEVDAARALLEDEDEDEEPREDAAPSPTACCILVPAPAPPTAVLDAVQRALGQVLEVEREPHVTVLYLGEVAAEALPEIVAAVVAEAAEVRAEVATHAVVRTFPAGSSGTPVVLELDDGWALASLNERLLRRLAHVVVARQFARFRPHLTLGYVHAPLSAEAVAALALVDASEVRVPVAAIQVLRGAEVLATVPVGG